MRIPDKRFECPVSRKPRHKLRVRLGWDLETCWKFNSSVERFVELGPLEEKPVS